MNPITITPLSDHVDVLLTARTPLSHHDAAEQTDANRLLFNRQRQLLRTDATSRLPTQAEVDAVVGHHPVPPDLAPLCDELSCAEFVAVALVRLWLDLYNRGDGNGLFAGLARYERLEPRLRQAAIQSHGLRGVWDRLCQTLQVTVHAGEHDAVIVRTLALPRAVQGLVLRVLAEQTRSTVQLARYWHDLRKRQSAMYAARAGDVVAAAGEVQLRFDAAAITATGTGAQVYEVPAISANSVRHQLVRAPAWWRLATTLGLAPTAPGQGVLPASVEALFVNGGNIAAGAVQPSNPNALAQQMRALYPPLDLLGGVVDSFDLGESRLKVSCWIVCRENREALPPAVAAQPEASVSVFDLLDDVTHTRQATDAGVGQMIYSFQTLCAGTPVLVRCTLDHGTPALTRGACAQALVDYLACPTLGGQAARGFGAVDGALDLPAQWAADQQAYLAYLTSHADPLREGLTAGTLGTARTLLT